jgi:nucleoside phosphorylase/tetratricopeptide (TPR) repeat protein
MPAPTVFISYSHQDEEWKNKLLPHLHALEMAGVEMQVWHDRKIDGGDKWYPEIEHAMANAAVAVLLVSPDFLASEFCVKQEVPAFLKRQENDGMLLLPLLLRPCAWEAHRWLKDRQMIPRDGKSIAIHFKGARADEVFAAVASKVLAHFQKLASQPTATIAVPAPVQQLVAQKSEPPDPAIVPPPRVVPRPELPADCIDLTRLPETGSALFGRDAELILMDEAWSSPDQPNTIPIHVLAFTAHGGVGKSTLVNHWLTDMARDHYRGATRVFGWSFYSQGVRDTTAASADSFIDAALRFFGDSDPTAGSPWDKGSRLGHLVGSQRALLVLDGMEPLQSAHAFERGKLRDPALESLLRTLARYSSGLCLITTREPIPDLSGKTGATIHDLEQITPEAGRALLRTARVAGTDAELKDLATRYGPHALAVTLRGVYLYSQPGHGTGPALALERLPGKKPIDRVLAGFEQWLGDTPEREALRLLGFFDRPADTGCLRALRAAPAVANLNDRLSQISDVDWNQTLDRLEKLRLVHIQKTESGERLVDAHPLIREHFAEILKLEPTWKEGHRRLYEHLCTTTSNKPDATLEDLQPLYQAVAHGCLAGLQQDACDKVYIARVLRGNENYSTFKLGALGSDLGAIACFFETPWSRVSPALTETKQGWLLNEAAYTLRSLGRLTEALEPMRAAMELAARKEHWSNAAIGASNLSELELTLGEVTGAVKDAEQSVTYADRSGDASWKVGARTTHADALHQVGRRAEAEALFREAEQMQAESQPKYPLLYSLPGFRYCDLLLTEPERAAWQLVLRPETRNPKPKTAITSCLAISERATKTLKWEEGMHGAPLLDFALHHLTLGRAALYAAILEKSAIRSAGGSVRGGPIYGDVPQSAIESAVSGLRRAGQQDYIPHALLTSVWLRTLTGPRTGPESAQADLDEAWEIAERGPMPLFLADIHLHRARLFFRAPEYPWNKNPDGAPRGPLDDLAAARRLIEKHGYWRRKEELEDAESAVKLEARTIKRHVSGRITAMKIPNPVLFVIGDVLGSWFYSHTKLDTLFGGNGFPGNPPPGNCVQKCQEWMRRANESPDVDALELLGLVLVEFMNLDRPDEPRWHEGFRRVTEVLAKNGFAFERNGKIVPVTPMAPKNVTLPSATTNQGAPANPPPVSIIERAHSENASSSSIIVLVTVNDIETNALLDTFVGTDKAPVHLTRGGITYSELGVHGGHRIVNTICEMGAGGVGASQQRAREAIEHWQPRAIIAVGIAFGLDETKQSIGDVLVSTQIQDFELGRLNADGKLTPRGDKSSCADVLRNRLRQIDTSEKRRNSNWPKVRFGLVLSGQKLVDNLDYRESLKVLFTEAIGGEMEGVGIYVSACTAKVDWIVVKGICDWGYNKNQADKDAWQRLAARNAAQVLKSALDAGALYSDASLPAIDAEASLSTKNPRHANLDIWQEKLDFLRVEEAKAASAAEKFSIKKEIESAEAKIREYRGRP